MKKPKYLPMPEEIVLHDYPNFTPHYKPTTMLKLGVFGGTYFNDVEPSAIEAWKNLRYSISDSSPFWNDLHVDLPACSDFSKAFCEDEYILENNFFKVKAGKDQKYWEDKGWIHPDDPRGWFEWYIKFYYGRRHEDDARQIKRWADFVKRQYGMLNYLTRNLITMGPTSIVDTFTLEQISMKASPATCQNLLHWSWNFNYKPNIKNHGL